ncbi:hypothetical protein KQI65_01815 [bacterium]|nr:hypothetical protein [bacterium]
MEQTQRAKLDLALNQPRTLVLLFDNPLTGENRYGPYYLYAFADPDTGEELSFFAPSEAHDMLEHYNAGDRIEITKHARQSGKNVITQYIVVPANGGPLKSKLNGNGKAASPAPHAESSPVTPSTRDKLYDLMLQSYKDALAIQQEVNSLNVDKCALSLYISRQRMLTSGNGVALTSLT